MSGVIGLANEITIKPHVAPADVKRKIEDALKRSAEVEAKGITVSSLSNGQIVLEGKVHDWRERDAVKRAAWSAAGVLGVDDRLQIA